MLFFSEKIRGELWLTSFFQEKVRKNMPGVGLISPRGGPRVQAPSRPPRTNKSQEDTRHAVRSEFVMGFPSFLREVGSKVD